MGFELKKYIAPDFTEEMFVSAPDAVLPVSYTHLDVYKRQSSSCFCIFRLVYWLCYLLTVPGPESSGAALL